MRLFFALLLTSNLLFFNSAFASLGGAEADLKTEKRGDLDQQTDSNHSAPGYKESSLSIKGVYVTVHELNLENTAVRQYAYQGKIFAVTWSGARNPDLVPLLGNFAKEYQQALEIKPRRHGRSAHQTVTTGNITVARSGHSGAFQGRAIATALLPTGVTANEIP